MDSYEDILSRMVERYRILAGFTPSEESDIMIRLKVLAGEIFNSTVATEFLKQQMFAQTASGEFLDKHATSRGLKRKEAQKATGEVTFSVIETAPSDIVIEAGTVVSTIGEDVKQFETVGTVTLKAGTTNVKANVVALFGGNDYNVLANEVTVLVTPPTGITGVKNEKAFKGGVDAETDEELRQRVLDSYIDISNSTNEIYYKRLVESVPGVYSSSVISQRRGPGTIDIFICGKGSAKITLEHIEKAQELVDRNRELNVDAFVLYSTPIDVKFVLGMQVHDGYNFDQISSVVKAKITDYVDSVGVGKPVLLSALGDIVYHTTGVKNYFFYDAYCEDVIPQINQYCVVKEIEIRQV